MGQSGNLRLRVFARAGRVDCVGGVFQFFIVGELKRHAAPRFGFSEAACDETLDLLFGLAPNDDESVEAFVNARFDEQSGFDENGITGIFFLPHCELQAHGIFDARVKNGIQLRKFSGVSENDRAEFFSIDRFVRTQDLISEFLHDRFVGRLAGLEEFVAELVSVENAKVHFTQAGRDETLAAGDSSG